MKDYYLNTTTVLISMLRQSYSICTVYAISLESSKAFMSCNLKKKKTNAEMKISEFRMRNNILYVEHVGCRNKEAEVFFSFIFHRSDNLSEAVDDAMPEPGHSLEDEEAIDDM